VRQLIPSAFISKSGSGNYVYAGGYPNRDAAESLKHFLRSQGLDARVLYF
jgi:cell division protein FtsN